MVKIKQKKTMNLPQLIEWGWGNPSLSKNKRFFSKDENLGITKHCVHFNDFGYPEVDNRYCLEPSDTFTVEVEEEVNGETILDRLYEVYFDGLTHDTNIFTNTTTNSLITSKTELIYTVIDNQVIVLWEKYAGGFR